MLTAKEIIVQSIRLYKKNMGLFFHYLLLLLLPIAAAILAGILFTLFFSEANQTLLTTILSVSILIAIYFFSLWITLAFIRAIAFRIQEQSVPHIAQELRDTWPLVIPTLIVSILSGLAIFGGSLLLIIPGIIFSVWFAFSVYPVLLENKRPIEAMKQSKWLVKGRWGAVLWRLIAPAIIFGIVILIVEGLFELLVGVVANELNPNSGLFLMLASLFGLLNAAITLLFTPLTTAAPTMLYLELKKTRMKE